MNIVLEEIQGHRCFKSIWLILTMAHEVLLEEEEGDFSFERHNRPWPIS